MNTSRQGRAMLESFEGLRLQSYRDSVGVWTIGYGSTEGVVPNQFITKANADILLSHDLKSREACVTQALKVDVTQAQFDAMVSLCYNIGCKAFADSLVLSLLNAGAIKGAADMFLHYAHAGGKEIPGLMKRRMREREVFLNGYGA